MLDKESFTLEELLEEDDVIQECKSLNSRLVNLCVPPAKPRSRPRRVARVARFSRTVRFRARANVAVSDFVSFSFEVAESAARRSSRARSDLRSACLSPRYPV